VLEIFNTLTKTKDLITPIRLGEIGMYTCGPTVYRYAHIGNMRTYMMADFVRRILEYRGIKVNHVKNITDVGHMRQELLETGGDKMILAALSEGKTIGEIAQYYADQFHKDEHLLNILPATNYPWATDHIPEMLTMVEALVEKNRAYLVDGNIYYDVGQFNDYGKLSRNIGGNLLEGVRVETDPLKKDPRDFTLWKQAEPGRDVYWDSKWGPGFPGWHIECSAMAEKYLGKTFDIHTGGIDNVFPHHEDEIAQSEAVFDAKHVNYWIHGQHLLADGAKMAKSSGNVFMVSDLIERGFDPIAFRYLCLTVRYRHRMNFTFSSLRASQKALDSLRLKLWQWKSTETAFKPTTSTIKLENEFIEIIENDLDLPKGVAFIWNLVKSDISNAEKFYLITKFDSILGLGLGDMPTEYLIPEIIKTHNIKRQTLRASQKFQDSDKLRSLISFDGFIVQDDLEQSTIRPKTYLERIQSKWPSISSPKEIKSNIDNPSNLEYTFILNAYGYKEDIQRCVESIARYAVPDTYEVIVIDNGSTDGTGDYLESFNGSPSSTTVIHCDHVLGDAAAKNIGLKLGQGKYIVILDASAELTGEIDSSIQENFSKHQNLGILGPFGLKSDDMQHFHEEVESGPADAMQGYCMIFPRALVTKAGMMRECFRFYRNLDIDFSFQIKNSDYSIWADSTIPIIRHEHRQWTELDDNQRDELSVKNFGRFLKKWGTRHDLLLSNSD
jgi:cysteinyl-tRNA synthetase